MAIIWFLFPHPDDEFAVISLVRDHCQSGDRVICAFLTDGSFAGQSPTIRRQESQRVLARLGVERADMHFIGEAESLADGALCRMLEPALAALERLRAETEDPDRIYCPAWEGGHQDHDALHLLTLALGRQLGTRASLRQYSLYHGSGLPGPFFRLLNPLPANGPTEDRKSSWRDRYEQLRSGWSYPSQWRTWLGLFPFLAWHVLTDGRVRLQPLNPGRVEHSPHAGPPLYERRGFMSYESFRDSSAGFIADRISKYSRT